MEQNLADSALGSASICGDALSERSVLFWHPTFESGQDEFVIQSLRILDPDDFEYLVVLSLHRFLVAPLDRSFHVLFAETSTCAAVIQRLCQVGLRWACGRS